jgi:tetratricopeptide (TPR) repeat protein
VGLIMRIIALFFLFVLVCCQHGPSQRERSKDKASHLLKDGLFREALDEYNQIIEQDPSDYESIRNIGIVYVKLRNYAEAIVVLEKVAKIYTTDYETQFYLAEAYRAQKKYEKAIFRYQLAIQLKSTKEANLALSWTYYQIRFFEASLKILSPLVRRYPKDASLGIVYVRVLIAVNKLDLAFSKIKNFQKYVDSKSISHFMALEGDVLVQLKKTEKAKFIYKRALKLNQMLAGAHFGLGKIYLGEKKFDIAKKYLEVAFRINADLPEIHYYLGKIYEISDLEKAKFHYKLFEKYRKHDPNYLHLVRDAQERSEVLKR